MAGSVDGEAGVERNKAEKTEGKKTKQHERKEVVTSKALRRSRRVLVLSLSSSAWLASGSAFGGGPVSGSV